MYTSAPTILFAEDDLSLALLLKETLEQEGYNVIHCADGLAAIEVFDADKIDLCLLDIMMPQRDGFTVAKKIRQYSDRVPILFLTTQAHESDKLKGYDYGADDYLAKPFSVQELLKKIEVFLKRTRKIFVKKLEPIKIGKLVFYPDQLKMITPSRTLSFTQKESEILLFLSEQKGNTVQRKMLLMNIWGKDDYYLGRSMDVFISRLRKHLKDDPSVRLETIHKVGFRLIWEDAENDKSLKS